MQRPAQTGILDYSPLLCDTHSIVHGLQKFTPVEAALGRDMSV
jgi:hypothetical protein